MARWVLRKRQQRLSYPKQENKEELNMQELMVGNSIERSHVFLRAIAHNSHGFYTVPKAVVVQDS